MSCDISQEISCDTSQEISRHISQEISCDISQEISRDISQEMSCDISQEAAESRHGGSGRRNKSIKKTYKKLKQEVWEYISILSKIYTSHKYNYHAK